MDMPFPFGFDLPSVLYLVLMVVTLVIHVIFMNYVLAGSLYLATIGLIRGAGDRGLRSPMGETLRDWLPFYTGLAITAGVAPLLFVQILYKQRFYTANLLGFHRWMLILPVLIVAFYLLYIMKTKMILRWPGILRMLVGLVAFACFAFIAWSWTENYLLSVADQATWNAHYAQGKLFHYEGQLVPRLGVWFIGALPTMATIIGWQLIVGRKRDQRIGRRETRHTAGLAIVGLLAAIGFGFWYVNAAGQSTMDAMLSTLALPYFVIAVVGVPLQLLGWAMQWLKGELSVLWLSLATLGAVATVLGMTVTREAVRILAIGPEEFAKLAQLHAQAARVGALVVFLLFFVLMIVAVIYTIRLVNTQRITPPQTPAD